MEESDENTGVTCSYELKEDHNLHITHTMRIKELANQTSRYMVNLDDQMLKAGLIALGWTPPPEQILRSVDAVARLR